MTLCRILPVGMASDEKRSVGLLGATSIGIGGMVGGGIFAVLGVAATGAGGATPLAFLVGGAVAALTAYSYAKLSVRYESAGGTVAFIDRVFGTGALTGSLNIVLWAGYIATTALYATAFGNYASSLIGGDAGTGPVVLRILILVGVVIPWAINLANAGLIARSEGVIVALKMMILLAVVAAGVPTMSVGRLAVSNWPSAWDVVAAGMFIFVAYEGFELIANSSADVARPERNLPLAFALSVGIVIVVYFAIAAVVVGSLSPEAIVRSADFALAEAASESLGQVGFVMVGVSAVLATFSAINATLYGSARLSYTIATEGELPSFLEKATWNQPVGLHFTAFAGLALAIGLPLDSISGLSSAIFLIVFAVVNGAALKMLDSVAGRALAGLGLVGCVVSLGVLVSRSISDHPSAAIALAVMLTLSLGFEHFFLRGRRGALVDIDSDH